VRRIVEGYLKNAKNAVLDLAPPTLQFFTIAPVLTSTLTVAAEIAAIRRLYIGLRDFGVRYNYYKKTVVLVWPGSAHADRGLSRPISVFRTTIGVCKNLSRSVVIWQYEDQNLFLSKNRERPSIGLAVNNRIYIRHMIVTSEAV